MTWATFLLSLVQPIIVQALLALGVGVVTVAGIDLALNQAMQWLTSSVGGLGSDVANVLAMGGIFQGIGYIGGALSARVAMAGVSSFKKFFIK
ncbi:cobalt ABC transporter permease [Burkholderia ubonensis]|uniref:DUF2523 domain-containing protein n=1 Tax=Burkholderia cepacia complex TaxID=87882 RepID=UPI000752E5F3|nr:MULTISPECIES: DUF2523 domain-containing protein [Burkholderia cepacia complex]KVP85462.1 cobalt ABC transporter permease [Burkholderia ubonensis]KVT36627.1 cobalt ABC transporter permease [Burkholderia ubonensis]KWI20442.1 cobalt ABC transporter permease [Burkholderia ubonensis]KWI80248.1 cobalt ABC transporter permease [Burkholderia ubonensis]MDN7616980.1 DUF2523 domain-containing protein [Burkholderia cepacia]